MKGKKDNGSSAKKPICKRWWFWVIIVVIISAIFGNMGGGDKDEGKNTSSTSAETEASQQLNETKTTETAEGNNAEAAEELSGEDAIRKAIENVVGEENLETFNYVPDNNFSLIKFRGTENLTNNMTVQGMYLDMFNILKGIQSIIDTDVDFNVVYPLQDKYGNVSDVIVIKATFTSNTIQKINFENALFGNIPDLADEWWNHNAVDINK